jgi:hypothetical protein
MSDSVFNPQLLKYARQITAKAAGDKAGFVDPAMAGGGGAPPGGDPAAAGGAAPMAGPMPPMPGMGPDPAAAGGAPPGGDPMADIQPMIEAAVQQALAAQGGGAGAGGAGAGGQKMKVDVNTEIYHLKKMMAMLMDQLGVQVPPTMLLGDPADDPQVPPGEAAKDPASAAAGQGSAIGPIDPIQGASPALAAAGGGGGGAAPKAAEWEHDQGLEVDSQIVRQTNQAAALLSQLQALSSSR